MLNKGSPANEIKKADLTKIKKLEEALAKLKSGEENYYVITKLSSIKSLCQNETIRLMWRKPLCAPTLPNPCQTW